MQSGESFVWKTTEGSTGRLVQLCGGYFFFYVLTGIVVKYYTGMGHHGLPPMNDIAFLAYNTLGANLTCLIPAVVLGWYHLQSVRRIHIGRFSFPSELLYIVPSGICTAIVIPTTTLMYTLPISVMVAMVIMRASVIVIGRVVDGIQIAQGILHKRVYWEENVAVVFAVLAAGIELFGPKAGGFDFLRSKAAVVILGSYLVAYAVRIYIMNYFKNTRPKGAPLDNKGFFATEQIAASTAMVAFALFFFRAPRMFPAWGEVKQIAAFVDAIQHPSPFWVGAAFSGLAFGIVAFFSVFIFMFKGRTATFTGLVNRLTSLVAGTVATLFGYFFFHMKRPSAQNWFSLALVFVAVGFLTSAERKRARELKAVAEI
jgi:hypothetical protein